MGGTRREPPIGPGLGRVSSTTAGGPMGDNRAELPIEPDRMRALRMAQEG
jgi:hypothetical protein